jgi:hypothetical protein
VVVTQPQVSQPNRRMILALVRARFDIALSLSGEDPRGCQGIPRGPPDP